MIIAMAAAILMGGLEQAPPPAGACAWSRLPVTEQQAVLAAYDRRMSAAVSALGQRDALLRGALADCLGRTDVPAPWAQAAIAANVIQLGASGQVQRDKGLDRERLDQAWETAGRDARNCVLNNAEKAFRLEGTPCPDPKAGQAFIEVLGLSASNRTDRRASEQVLMYMNAKAQGIIAETLIAMWMARN